MPGVFNQLQQPVGMTLSDQKGVPFPQVRQITGRYCKLKRINAKCHVEELYEAYCESSDCRDWTYLAVGSFETFGAFQIYLKKAEEQIDPMHLVVIDSISTRPVGTFALMRINPVNGTIEVGHVSYSICMKRSRISTEAIPLPLKYVFEDLGYRRFEQKCDVLNAPSREAVERFGFNFEGIFRQAVVTRGRNRGTMWYSIVGGEYPTLHPAYDLRLDERSFDNQGRQIKCLGELMERG